MSEAAICGLELRPMPEGWTPLEAFCVMTCLDDDGEVALLMRGTEGLRSWDTVGMLTAALDVQRDLLRSQFASEDDEPDDLFPTFGDDA